MYSSLSFLGKSYNLIFVYKVFLLVMENKSLKTISLRLWKTKSANFDETSCHFFITLTIRIMIMSLMRINMSVNIRNIRILEISKLYCISLADRRPP